MYKTTYLEWWHQGEWHQIGWVGNNPHRTKDLEAHGEALASGGGYYRLVSPNIFQDAPPTVVREYAVVGQ